MKDVTPNDDTERRAVSLAYSGVDCARQHLRDGTLTLPVLQRARELAETQRESKTLCKMLDVAIRKASRAPKSPSL